MTNDNGSRFLRACRRERVDRTPIWLMRQAGRYMAEYRKVRERHSILEIIKTPELACEVTLQPLDAFELDAGIIFSDILPPLEGMGLDLEFTSGEGPVIRNPVRSTRDVEALRVLPANETMGFTLDAIRLVRRELEGRGVPLIGFSGAPFTLACYAIEGGGSRNYLRTKQTMSATEAWRDLMDKMSTVVADYLVSQADAGAQVLQLFDTWAGELSPRDYKNKVMPYTKSVIEKVRQAGVPIIYFGKNMNGMLEVVRELGSDVVGIDWRIDLDEAWRRLGDGVAIQGNLDPAALFDPWDELKKKAKVILEQASGRCGHIFNLGHGILPKTPVDNVRRLVDYVHGTEVQKT
ncbi:MAG: uroporphyrinogen decarboxylase [Candidatus Latescibacterota bacterium]|nr:MAG: uroporphyrinogen decarboxylase [Candidatus Latescibacterota bacterium]